MKVEGVKGWLQNIDDVLDEIIYERKEEFLWCLLAILAGKNIELYGDAGSGKSFFVQLLEPLRAFTGYPTITESREQTLWLSIAISPLKSRSSFSRMAQQRDRKFTLPLPEFLHERAIDLARQIPFDEEVLEALLIEQEKKSLTAQAWRDVIDLLAMSAYCNQREQISWEDLPLLERLGIVLHLPGVGDEEAIEKDLTLLELDVDNQLRQQQQARKLRKFVLVIKGQESETCRFLYDGEESHMLLSSYQQLLIHREKFISVSFYQPSGYGLAARPFRESFRLFDDFTLVDSSGHYYELLTEQVASLRRLSALSKQYLQAQLDAILQRILEVAKSNENRIENVFLDATKSRQLSEINISKKMMDRIKIIKSKLE